ncbi:MAG: GNAT family N-acetyltransferase [Pseudomonadota bacterium]
MALHVVPAPWPERAQALRELRHEVFVQEQQVPEALEWDGRDADCQHFMALDETGRLLGCARLTPDGQIGRMAVRSALRGQGIGRALLAEAVTAAAASGHVRVFLHAQEHAVPFYRSAGFLPEGEPYEEAGIPHQTMSQALPLRFEVPALPDRAPTARPATAASTSAPGEPEPTLPPVTFKGEALAQTRLLEALETPRRQLAIISPELDPTLFDQQAVCDALSRFVRSSASTRARILIYSSRRAVASSHRLIALARRLDERITIAKVPEAHAKDERTAVIWDNVGYWLQPDTLVYEGLLNGHDPVMATRLQERFDYLWERSGPDPELRQLKL